MPSSISIANLVPKENLSAALKLAIALLDRLVGVSKMNQMYQQHNMQGLSKELFATKLLEIMNIQVLGHDNLQHSIPETGPVVIASNHPFGGIEGVILCLLVGEIRSDLKVLANQGLKLFPELSDYFIFTNPLSEKDPKNAPSLRASLKHVKQGGAILIFPAGRVSYYQGDKKRVSEHTWNRVIAKLITATNAQYLPVFVSGKNSRLFYTMGRIYYRLRMFMLARELLNKRNAKITISCGTPVKAKTYKGENTTRHAALCRVQSYCQDPQWQMTWPADKQITQKPIAEETSWQVIQNELEKLPQEQHLLNHKDFDVYYGYQHQLPNTVHEIARLRELVFREHNEGSGEPIDTDHFDATYTQLFVVNEQQQKIVGAYRMGRTDELLKDGDLSKLYLAKMFKFGPQFVNQQRPCLELGRSFLIPDYQRSFQGLYLLWRGIGAFVCKYPHYRTLYGTVSLSKLYSPRGVALIKHALISDTKGVEPFNHFDFPLHHELIDYDNQHGLKGDLSPLLACVEQDGKDIPILAKHYQKLGAKFHCLGIDKSFNDTPGLLLSVDLPQAPEKLLKLYLGEQWKDYKEYYP
ncbi:lysophospholipid acyltransferase family protein [Aliiglaciecola sp.]|nr:lysophospholipid acyltransferase family protein [Aliiglaciecola sp.]